MEIILIISTGGTISSFKTREGYFNVSDENHFDNPLSQTINSSAEEFNQKIIHEQPISLLSEMLSPSHWLIIANAVREALKKYSDKKINKIIITHGSDTLSYTASALAFLLIDIEIPILMVAALQSPNEKNSDALINVRAALMYAKSNLAPLVYIVFADAENKVALCSAVLSENIQNYVHHLPILKQKIYMSLSVDDITQKKPKLFDIVQNKKLNSLYDIERVKTINNLYLDTVKLFHVYPSLTAQDMLNVIKPIHCKVVLLNLYHSGTASSDGCNNLIPLLDYCAQKNVMVFGLPFDGLHATGKQYVTTHALLDKGMIALPVMSLTTAYTKLVVITHYYLNNNDNKQLDNVTQENIKNIMMSNMIGEYV